MQSSDCLIQQVQLTRFNLCQTSLSSFSVLALATILVGCSSVADSEVKNRSGVTLGKAENAVLKLNPRMKREEVESLLGPPDETAIYTYGADVGKAWGGIAWKYQWKLNSRPKLLFVVFQDGDSGWIVNHWRWYDYEPY
jgi:hypothetical protein